MLGPYRLDSVRFWTTISSESAGTGRRGPQSFLQMICSDSNGAKSDDSGEIPDNPVSPSETLHNSPSIKELLSRNPALVQLLNAACAKKPMMLPTSVTPKARPVLIEFKDSPVLRLFPSDAVLVFNDPTIRILLQDSTYVIINEANRVLYESLQAHTSDPLLRFADLLPKEGLFANLSFQEVGIQCIPPIELTSHPV